MAEKVEVLSQTLAESSLKKLTASRGVLQNKIDLFPPELQQKGKGQKADLTFLKDGNEEILSVVTVSLQSVSKAPRLVFLQKGWKTIVEELRLRKGDKVTIFLIDRKAWTYSIRVEKAPTAEREAQANVEGGHVSEIDEAASVAGVAEGFQLLADCALADFSGLQLLADCAVKMMKETSNKPAVQHQESDLTGRPSFDLNLPPTDTEF